MSLKDKHILFISARFFNYEKAIVSKMEELGAKVDYYDERPSNSVLTKGLIRVNPKFLKNKIDSYYRKILNETASNSYNFFFLIKGEAIPFWFIDKFKKLHPETENYLYLYDTIKEYPKFKELIPYFDKTLTFEHSDSVQYNIQFQPIFYLDEYAKQTTPGQKKYDVSFIGSAHTDRYQIGQEIKSKLDDLELKSFFYYYAPGRLTFLLKRIFDKNLKKFDTSKLNFNKLSHSEIKEIYDSSFSVLDINKPFQLGISNRIYEALVTGRKIITTNTDIEKYPFYDSTNIMILNRNCIEIDKEFFQTEFKPMSKNILEKLSVEGWLNSIFIKSDEEFWRI